MIPAQKRARLKPYDKMLKQFRHREALDAALGMNDPIIVTSLIEELASRNALNSALGKQISQIFHSFLSMSSSHFSQNQERFYLGKRH